MQLLNDLDTSQVAGGLPKAFSFFGIALETVAIGMLLQQRGSKILAGLLLLDVFSRFGDMRAPVEETTRG